MDSNLMQALAKVAGIGGIALGVLLLLFRDIIRKAIFPTFTKEHGYKTIRLMLWLIWSIAFVGILAWLYDTGKQTTSSQPTDRAAEQVKASTPEFGKNPKRVEAQTDPSPTSSNRAKASVPEVNKNAKKVETQADFSSTSSNAREVAFVGNILFADGKEVKGCKLWDHNPGPIGSGWNEASVGYCASLDAALNHTTNRSRTLQYSRISQIDVLPFSASEKEVVASMDLYDRDKILKCNVVFQDGSRMNGVFLLPNYLEYECANEKGRILRDTTKSLMFRQVK
jgi:hypothetical protein